MYITYPHLQYSDIHFDVSAMLSASQGQKRERQMRREGEKIMRKIEYLGNVVEMSRKHGTFLEISSGFPRNILGGNLLEILHFLEISSQEIPLDVQCLAPKPP